MVPYAWPTIVVCFLLLSARSTKAIDVRHLEASGDSVNSKTSEERNYPGDPIATTLKKVFGCDVTTQEEFTVTCDNVDIESLAPHIPPETVHLEIRNSHREILRKPLFSHLKRLKSLTLHNNSHVFVTSRPFQGLEELVELNLSSNSIAVLKNTFYHIPKLQLLDLSGNRFFSVARVAAAIRDSGLTNLKTLIMNHSVNIARISENDFLPIEHIPIEEFELSNSVLQRVDHGAFRHLTFLKVLRLSVNYVGEEALLNITSGLAYSPVEEIVMREMLRFTGLPVHALSPLTNTSVLSLDLSYNHFPVVSQFPSIPSLKVLFLVQCSVKTIEPDAFVSLKNLTHLVLTHNHISSIGESIASLSGLQVLILSNQELESQQDFLVRGFVFRNMKSLRLLDFSKTRLGNIYRYEFAKLGSLEFLSLVEVGANFIEEFAFENLSALWGLDLRGNSLTELTNYTFYGLRNLSVLLLASNQITLMGPETFHRTPSLQVLHMGKNQLNTIPAKAFSGTRDLRKLILNDNSIFPWNETILSSSTNLSLLYLARNQIAHLTPSMMSDIGQVTSELDLSNNPFNCSSCDLKQLQTMLNASTLNLTTTFGDRASYVCMSPPELRGQLVEDVDFEAQGCFQQTPWLNIGSLAIGVAVFFLFVSTGWLCFGLRWYLKYFVFRCTAQVKERKDGHSENKKYLYDAFVCYSSADYAWVLSELIPNLENSEPKKRLCIHERDFEPGRLITENILEAIEASRKVILILSEEFIKSEWCMFELHMAQHKLFEDTRDVLVLVKLRPIDRKQLNRNLAYLSKTRTCLQWTGSLEAQKHFWTRLRKALEPKAHGKKAEAVTTSL